MKKLSVLFFIDLSGWEPHQLPSFVGPLADNAEGLSIHWVLTPGQWSTLLESPEGQLTNFRQRLAKGSDRILPVNFSGFSHQDFFPTEAAQDCGWCYHHPEKGLGKYLNVEAGPVFLARTAAQSLGYNAPAAHPLVLKSADIAKIFIFKDEYCGSWPLFTTVSALKNDSSLQGLWWAPDIQQDSLKSLSQGQFILNGLSALSINWPRIEDLVVQDRPAMALAALSPREKAPMAALGERRLNSDVPVLLKNFFFKAEGFPGTGEEEDAENAENLHGVRKRALIASMQGESVLSEGPFQVFFHGGSPREILEKGTGKVLAQAEVPYITTNQGTHQWRNISAFSLEGDYSWGLRQTLVMEGKGIIESGRMVIDHFFVEESHGFFQSVSVRFPKWEKGEMIKAWSFLPWEFPLMGSPHTNVRVQRVYADGTRFEENLGLSQTPRYLEGCDFSFALPGYPLILSFPQNQTPRPHTLETRLNRKWSRTVLKVCPEGGSQIRPSGDFEGWDEHFTFAIHFKEIRLPFSPSRKQANEIMPPFIQPTP